MQHKMFSRYCEYKGRMHFRITVLLDFWFWLSHASSCHLVSLYTNKSCCQSDQMSLSSDGVPCLIPLFVKRCDDMVAVLEGSSAAALKEEGGHQRPVFLQTYRPLGAVCQGRE
jgi:hypothetical protein